MAGLQISGDQAQAFARAKPGAALNLSASEIAAFNALASGDQNAVQQKLAGDAPRALPRVPRRRPRRHRALRPRREDGRRRRRPAQATEHAKVLEKYLPAFHAMLLGYPKAPAPNASERFFWATYDVSGTPTYVLVHIVTVAEGAFRGFAQRQYYVSTGYNGEQAVGGFLPCRAGIVAYAAHAFTDQVAGFGGAMKRNIGRRVMAEKLRAMFDEDRKRLEK